MLYAYLRYHCHWLDKQQATCLRDFSRVLPVIKNNVTAYVFRSAKIEKQLIIAVHTHPHPHTHTHTQTFRNNPTQKNIHRSKKCDSPPKKMKALFMEKEMSYWCLTHCTIFMVNPLWMVATFPDTNPHTSAFTVDFFFLPSLFLWRHMCRWVSQELIKLWFLRDYPVAQLNFVRFTWLKQYPRISGWL